MINEWTFDKRNGTIGKNWKQKMERSTYYESVLQSNV